jgi:hypothetical protein
MSSRIAFISIRQIFVMGHQSDMMNDDNPEQNAVDRKFVSMELMLAGAVWIRILIANDMAKQAGVPRRLAP